MYSPPFEASWKWFPTVLGCRSVPPSLRGTAVDPSTYQQTHFAMHAAPLTGADSQIVPNMLLSARDSSVTYSSTDGKSDTVG